MDVGTSGRVFRMPGDTRPLEELYRELVDRGVAAEANGYDFFNVSEHHFMDTQWNPSPLMILAGIATRTSTIRLGTNVLLTPLYHPLRLAEDVASLDLLSGGRVDFVAGTGSMTNEFETYDVPPHERHGRTFETLKLLRGAFGNDVYSHEGRYFKHPNIVMTTRPVQDPFPLWFGGMGPKNLRHAGREGYHAQTPMGAPFWWDAWEEGVREGGRDPDELNFAVFGVGVTVVATEQEVEPARERAHAAAVAQAEDYGSTRDLGISKTGVDPIEEAVKRGGTREQIFEAQAVGTPDMVLEALEPRLKDSRVTHAIVRLGSGTDEQLFLDEIAPVLRTWGRTPVNRPLQRS